MTTFVWVLAYLMIAVVLIALIKTWPHYEDSQQRGYAIIGAIGTCAAVYVIAIGIQWIIQTVGGYL